MTGFGDTNQPVDGTAAATKSANDAVTTDGRDKPTIKQLEAAMLTLRARDREIFLAHRLDNMSYRQMAEITGLPVKQIQRAMSRAIGDLDRALCGQPRQRRRWWPF